MKGVIMQVGENKCVVLFTNGKFGSIPTPKNAQVGMVIHISSNRKRVVLLVVLVALVLVLLLAGAYSFFKSAGHWEVREGIENGRVIEEHHRSHSVYCQDMYDR